METFDSFLTIGPHRDPTSLVLSPLALDNRRVLHRFLHRTHDGSLRRGRLIVLLAVCGGLALFGTGLLVLAPRISDSALGQGLWVMFVVVALKFPLIAILWSFIRRNAEWPGRPVVWSDQELGAILERLDFEASRAAAEGGGEARLAHLSREAWHVADNVSGEAKVDALTVALGIDERLIARRSSEAAG